MDFENQPILKKIKIFFLNLLAIFSYYITIAILLKISAKLSLLISIISLIIFTISLIKPTILKTPNWLTKIALVILILWSTLGIPVSYERLHVEEKENKTKELANLKLKDPKKYLSELKNTPESHALYLTELELMYPDDYKIEIDRIAQAEADALRKEHQELKNKLGNLKSLSEQQRLDLYSQLLRHEPKNRLFKREQQKYQKIVDNLKKKEAARQVDIANEKKARDNPTEFLELSNFLWSKEGFGVVMNASFVIKNKSPIDIKDVTIVCKHSAASGTVIDENSRVFYDVIKAKSQKTAKDFNMGFIHDQAVNSMCYIEHAVAM